MVKRVNIYLLCNVVFYSRSCVLAAPLAIEKYLRGKRVQRGRSTYYSF